MRKILILLLIFATQMQMTYALSLSNKDINYITNRTYSGNYSKQYVYYYILKKYDSISAEKFDIAYSEKMLSKEAGGYVPVGAISRSEWGANESWANPESVGAISGNRWAGSDSKRAETVRENYQKNFGDKDSEIVLKKKTENGRDVEYFPVTGIIIHHTATSSKEPSGGWAEAVRSIYKMNALGNGWGDLGYNYLVAPDGSIYEGAEGGKYVVGAHVLGHNRGNIGVSLIGSGPTYPKEQTDALITLVAKLAKIYKLDITHESIQRNSDCSGLEYASAIRAHKELDPGKPVDPYINMDDFRKLVVKKYKTIP